MSRPLPPLTHPGLSHNGRAELAAFRQSLDALIPPKRESSRNLLIATWNIRAFASLTEKWTALQSDSPKRDYRGMWFILEVISRFDVIAIQELKGDLKALRTLMKTLGPNWSFLMTDVTEGAAGNSERLCFIFDATRLRLSGLACEIVVPEEWQEEISDSALFRQFARTPYAVGFDANGSSFVLVTLHVDYGKNKEERQPEIEAIAEWMRRWATQSADWNQNLIALGDFNIDRHGDDLWVAFTQKGLTVPAELDAVPRTIFDDANNRLEKYYDQIAWFADKDGIPLLSMLPVNAGGIRFAQFAYQADGLTTSQVSYRVSDHLPLWVEFDLPNPA